MNNVLTWWRVEVSARSGAWTFSSMLAHNFAKALDHQQFLEYEMGLCAWIRPYPL